MRLRRPWGSALSGAALWAASKVRAAQWDAVAKNPERAQLQVLTSLCRTASGTAFGCMHALGAVRSYADFRTLVRCRGYADYEPFLARMRAGEPDVLWPGTVPYFALSSGTSGTAAQKKYLPISYEQIHWQQRAGFDAVARYVAMSGDRTLGGGYTLCLWPPGTVEHQGAVSVGSNPGVMSLHLPRLASRYTLPGPEVRDIEDCATKLTELARRHRGHDVRSLSGTTCWFSLVFEQVLRAAREAGAPAETVSEVWPNLKVLFGGGVSAAPYRAGIDALMGRRVTLMENYNATEGGIFAVTDREDDEGLLVLPDRGVFFEFIPCGDVRRFPLWEVEPGVDYEVVVSTSSGLFAYRLGDCVRFTETFPHRLVFTGRVAGMLSLTQELTTQRELERAVTAAAAAHACAITDFAAATEMPAGAAGRGRYVVLVELERPVESVRDFERAVDVRLREENLVYGLHRAGDVAILPPRVVVLPAGALGRFRQAAGVSSLQHKFQRILTHRERDLLLSSSGCRPHSTSLSSGSTLS